MRGTRLIQCLGCLALTALVVSLAGCTGDGHFTLFGYTTVPNYDMGIRTVSVPIFKNLTQRRGLENLLTEAIVREIESKTPYKVAKCNADTELVGTIISRTKNPVVQNPLNEIRDVETILTVELVWRDLRVGHAGELLAMNRPHRADEPLLPPGSPGVPGGPQPPVVVMSLADFTPELGTSIRTAEQQNVDRLAVQIVSMMEKSW